LGELGATERLDTAAVGRFVRTLERPGGGFFGAAWDDTPDVEYTFYGLGTLALIQNTSPARTDN
jgi:geranylgeranyl transferase type-2 subunit beta